jgi:hypothetical protein
MDAPMAKKKAKVETPPEPKATVISVKGSNEWREWLQEGAEFCRTDTAKMLDAAIVAYLKAQGFVKPPPKR